MFQSQLEFALRLIGTVAQSCIIQARKCLES